MHVSPVVAETNPRLNVVVSPYDLKRLKFWAWLHGKAPSAYAGQILAARIEANFELIETRLEDCAKLQGISVDELKAEILNGNDD